MTTVFHAWPYSRLIEIQSNLRRKKLHITNQGSNSLGGRFSNRDNLRASIHFRRESQHRHLKSLFFLKNRLIHFLINGTSIIGPVKQNQLSFSSIVINKVGRWVCLIVIQIYKKIIYNIVMELWWQG